MHGYAPHCLKIANCSRPNRRAAEALDVIEPLEVHADGAHPIIIQQCIEIIAGTENSLIAGSDDVREAHGTVVHRQIHRDVSTLGNQRDALLDVPATKEVGPERAILQMIDEAKAVRTHQWHVT